jgi:hypothetical protein
MMGPAIAGVVFAAALAGQAGQPGAAGLSPAVVTALRCAPHGASDPEPAGAIRVIGSQDSSVRHLFGVRDLLVLDAGTARGLAVNQQLAIRRHDPFYAAQARPHAVTTTGVARIVSATDQTAIAVIELSCDGVTTGDYVEPYVEPVAPQSIDRADPTGELDFSTPARILFGDRDRWTAGEGDFMITDAAIGRGGQPGARFAIFRDLEVEGLPLAPVGEAVVIQADTNFAVVRITRSRDVIQRGDLLIPRRSR